MRPSWSRSKIASSRPSPDARGREVELVQPLLELLDVRLARLVVDLELVTHASIMQEMGSRRRDGASAVCSCAGTTPTSSTPMSVFGQSPPDGNVTRTPPRPGDGTGSSAPLGRRPAHHRARVIAPGEDLRPHRRRAQSVTGCEQVADELRLAGRRVGDLAAPSEVGPRDAQSVRHAGLPGVVTGVRVVRRARQGRNGAFEDRGHVADVGVPTPVGRARRPDIAGSTADRDARRRTDGCRRQTSLAAPRSTGG